MTAALRDGILSVEVANGGAPIPGPVLARLFEPFVRGAERTDGGLGLGLFIASQIARAHGGELVASSSEEETRLAFRMPARGGAEARSRLSA